MQPMRPCSERASRARQARSWAEPWRRFHAFPAGGYLEDGLGRQYVPASVHCLQARDPDGPMFEVMRTQEGWFPEVGDKIAMVDHMNVLIFTGTVCEMEYVRRGRTGLVTFKSR